MFQLCEYIALCRSYLIHFFTCCDIFNQQSINYDSAKRIAKNVHILQMHSWDCGLSCVGMVLKYIEPCYSNMTSDQILNKLYSLDLVRRQPETPLWTIDLFHILIGLNVNVTMYTSCIKGVDKHHFNIDWYVDCKVASDSSHVISQFNKAFELGLQIRNEVMSIQTLGYLLIKNSKFERENNFVAIVLVNASVLNNITRYT